MRDPKDRYAPCWLVQGTLKYAAAARRRDTGAPCGGTSPLACSWWWWLNCASVLIANRNLYGNATTQSVYNEWLIGKMVSFLGHAHTRKANAGGIWWWRCARGFINPFNAISRDRYRYAGCCDVMMMMMMMMFHLRPLWTLSPLILYAFAFCARFRMPIWITSNGLNRVCVYVFKTMKKDHLECILIFASECYGHGVPIKL